jgi:hypothetical protein
MSQTLSRCHRGFTRRPPHLLLHQLVAFKQRARSADRRGTQLARHSLSRPSSASALAASRHAPTVPLHSEFAAKVGHGMV